jgi:hypothetical protein
MKPALEVLEFPLLSCWKHKALFVMEKVLEQKELLLASLLIERQSYFV